MAGSGTRGHHEPVPVLWVMPTPEPRPTRRCCATSWRLVPRVRPIVGSQHRRPAKPGGQLGAHLADRGISFGAMSPWLSSGSIGGAAGGGAGGGAGSSSSSSSAPPRGRSDGRDPGLIRGTGSKEFGARVTGSRRTTAVRARRRSPTSPAADSSGPAWENSNSRRRSTSPTRAVCPTWLRSRATPTPTCRCARLRSWATSKRRRGRRRRNPPPSSTRRRRRPGPERTR